MTVVDLPRKLASEFLGTALLLAVVIGSGAMGEKLAGGQGTVSHPRAAGPARRRYARMHGS